MNDRNRSIALHNLRLDGQGAQFISLQKEVRDSDKAALKEGSGILDLSDDLHDFSATAALIANLDLVISVDTAVAHLAGALGKPVWLLLPFQADRRWLLEANRSPWYPTMTLFRQTSLGCWDDVLRDIDGKLRTFMKESAEP